MSWKFPRLTEISLTADPGLGQRQANVNAFSPLSEIIFFLMKQVEKSIT